MSSTDPAARVAAARRSKCRPRYGLTTGGRWKPTARVAAIIDAAARLGTPLHDWQVYALDHGLRPGPRRQGLRYSTVGVIVPRQVGKTLLGHILAAEALRTGRHLGYTAQDRQAAATYWKEGLPLWQAAFGDRVTIRYAQGSEEIRHKKTGGRVVVLTPSDRGPRGRTLDTVILDEAFKHDIDLLGAVRPTMYTKPNGQLWLLSNAGTGESRLLLHYRGIALSDDPEGVAWMEWAAASDADPYDPKAWAAAIPTLDVPSGISSEKVAEEATQTPTPVFMREMLNIWQLEHAGGNLIAPARWAAAQRPEVEHPSGEVWFAPGVSQHRDYAVIAAVSIVDGTPRVSVVESRDGAPSWVTPALRRLARETGGRIAGDIGGSTGTVVAELDSRKIKFTAITARAHARGCGLLLDAVNTDDIQIQADEDLTAAALACKTRRLAGAWAWDTSDATVQSAPLSAVSSALYAAHSGQARTTPVIHVPPEVASGP